VSDVSFSVSVLHFPLGICAVSFRILAYSICSLLPPFLEFQFLSFSAVSPDFFRFCVLICSLQKSVLAKYNRFAACDN